MPDALRNAVRLGADDVLKVQRALAELPTSPQPLRILNGLAARAGAPGTGAFERYAGMVLADAGLADLRDVKPGDALRARPSAGGRFAVLECGDGAPVPAHAAARRVEAALRRLVRISELIAEGSFEDEAPGEPAAQAGAADAVPGPGGPGEARGQQAAGAAQGSVTAGMAPALGPVMPYRQIRLSNETADHVRLPALGPTERPGAGYYCELDWRLVDSVADTGHFLFQSSLFSNLNQVVMGILAPTGGDWDARTRMAAIIEALDLPLPVTCRFDFNLDAQAGEAAFSMPGRSLFPQRAPHAAPDMDGDMLEQARRAFALRASCLLAAACFGSARHLHRVSVTALEGEGEGARPYLRAGFCREGFVKRTLPALDAGRGHDPACRFDAGLLAEIVQADCLLFGDGPAPDGFGMPATHRIEPWEDARVLSDDLKLLFRANRIRDIDVRHYFGGESDAVEVAKRDASDSNLAAIARLEQLVGEMESQLRPPEGDAEARPLYCSSALARAMVPLLDDELTVGLQAEEFLNPPEPADAADGGARPEKPRAHDPSRLPRYFRAPSALYNAHMGLSDLYQRIGDYPGSEAHADRCIALAPTTGSAYFRKADALAEQGRYAQAANVLMAGLRYAVSGTDCALLYYHLALLLWQLGRRTDAAAVHVYNASLPGGEFAEKSRRAVAGLRKRDDRPVIAFASPLAAAREMAKANVPVAPSALARLLVAQATLGLCQLNAPAAAAPYAAALASYMPDNPVVARACASIQHGAD